MQERSELSLQELANLALEQGIAQVKEAGSPLHPFLIDQSGAMYLLFDSEGGTDPMELACAAIKSEIPSVQRCALVIDSHITLEDGVRRDAILAMTAEKGTENGELWAQCYKPKWLFRKFRTEGEAQMISQAGDFITYALDDPGET